MTPVHHWRAVRLKVLLTVLGLIAIAALVVWLAIALPRPMPQRSLAMPVYPEGSLNAELAKRYRDILARDGVQLNLVPSAGAVESIAHLRDPNSGISVALVPGGLTTAQESPQLESLGTLFYQPLWVFSRNHSLDKHKPLQGLRISIGPEGSSSRAIAVNVLGQAGFIDKSSGSLLPLTPAESAKSLIEGNIDIAIFLDGWESPAVQQLLKAKNVSLQNIPTADAFVALDPYLDKLILPAGVADMTEPRPPKDVTLIAPKSSLVVRKDLHPAIQYLLLEAAQEIHSTPGVFHDAGKFPSPESTDLPLSPYAREFYKSGRPFLQRHLPFWLAVVLEQPMIWLLPLLVVLFPILRLAPAAYDWVEKRRVYRLYSDLKRLEDEMLLPAIGKPEQDLIQRLDRLEERASRLSVPSAISPLVYSLWLHIELVRQKAQKSTTT